MTRSLLLPSLHGGHGGGRDDRKLRTVANGAGCALGGGPGFAILSYSSTEGEGGIASGGRGPLAWLLGCRLGAAGAARLPSRYRAQSTVSGPAAVNLLCKEVSQRRRRISA